MTLTWEEACARVSGPGSAYEIIEDEHGKRRFKHAPPNLRTVFDIARSGGDDIFLVYEDERWTFDQVFAHIDALADALVNRYGIVKGDRSQSACATIPSGSCRCWPSSRSVACRYH